MAVNINVPSQVKTYANLAAFPATGALKTIYIAEDTNKTYRWTGSVYTEISASAAMTWGAIGGTLSNQTDLQNALDAKVPTTRTLTINGVTQDLSADRTFTISTGITIGSTAIASGTVGRVLFQGTGNVVQQSSSLFWDNTGFLGIGTSTPVAPSTYNGITINSATAGSYVWFQTGGVTKYTVGSESNVNYHNLVAGTSFLIRSGGSSYFNVVQSTGNVQIGTTTDAGFRLDVNGTARVKTDLKIETATGGLIIEGDAGGYPTLKINTLRSGTTRRNWMFATEQFNGGDFVLFRSATAGGVANTLVYSIFNDGNFGLNTSTNAGFRLDVNGTARVDQTLQLNGTGTGTLIAMGGNIGRFTIDGSFIRFKVSGGGDILNMTTNFFGVNETSVIPSAICAMTSTNRGFLPPRMTTTQKNAIASPVAGLMVYDTTLNVISYYNGSMWI